MKVKGNILIVVLCVLFSVFSHAQAWRDSLKAGKLAYESGNFDRAYTAFLEAQRLAPEEMDFSKDIGNVAYRIGDFSRADQAFTRAITNTTETLRGAKKWHNHGNAKMKQEDYAGAIESYKNALRLNPNASETRYNLAVALDKLKEQEQQNQDNDNQDQDNQDNEEDKDNQDDSENQDSQNQNNQDQNQQEENKEQDQQEEESQNQSKDNQQEGREQEMEAKLNQKRIERILDDLSKQEAETQRKIQERDASGKPVEVKSGKRW